MKVSLWLWIFLGTRVCSVSLPEITDGKFIEECVSEHNKARSSVSPPASNMIYMTWDEGLAVTARAWARRCIFQHNPEPNDGGLFTSVGENIWAAGFSPSHFDVRSAITDSWVHEKLLYNYNDNSCQGICGHYTQVVWARSSKLGCAVHWCEHGIRKTQYRSTGIMFVCNYGPAGNMNARRPYESGTPCTGCEGTCEESLCRYKGTQDGETSTLAGRFSLAAVVISRLIALVLTFLAAFVVHYFYPDIFYYE